MPSLRLILREQIQHPQRQNISGKISDNGTDAGNCSQPCTLILVCRYVRTKGFVRDFKAREGQPEAYTQNQIIYEFLFKASAYGSKQKTHDYRHTYRTGQKERLSPSHPAPASVRHISDQNSGKYFYQQRYGHNAAGIYGAYPHTIRHIDYEICRYKRIGCSLSYAAEAISETCFTYSLTFPDTHIYSYSGKPSFLLFDPRCRSIRRSPPLPVRSR